ncbi:acylphosphatase [Bacteroidota bacterium]
MVRGRVQGVGFRYSAVHMANRLGLKGYVKNLYDGSVMLEIEGPTEHVDEMIYWCKTGPGTGHVDDIELTEGILKAYKSFVVRY